MAAGGFEAIVQDLRILLRRAAERPDPPTAAILDHPGRAHHPVDAREWRASWL